MLVYKHDGYVFSLLGEGIEGLFDGVLFCFGIDDEEIAFGVGGVCYMLYRHVN
jgi:hypothetical protein